MTKVCLICHKKDKYGNEHGEFWVTPNTHLSNKSGCPKCAGRIKKKTLSEFINDAREIHGDKYDYSKVNYVNNQTKVCIICPEHGEFWQMPNHHLKGSGRPKCNQSHLEREIMQLLEENIERDKRKKEICEKHNVPIYKL